MDSQASTLVTDSSPSSSFRPQSRSQRQTLQTRSSENHQSASGSLRDLRAARNGSVSSQSQTSSLRNTDNLPPSPLDNIDSRLYDRFPRFSTTSEDTKLDLSSDGVLLSTRYSSDEEDMVRSPISDITSTKPIQRAMSSGSARLKKIATTIRKVPSSLWNKKVRHNGGDDRPESIKSSDFSSASASQETTSANRPNTAQSNAESHRDDQSHGTEASERSQMSSRPNSATSTSPDSVNEDTYIQNRQFMAQPATDQFQHHRVDNATIAAEIRRDVRRLRHENPRPRPMMSRSMYEVPSRYPPINAFHRRGHRTHSSLDNSSMRQMPVLHEGHSFGDPAFSNSSTLTQRERDFLAITQGSETQNYYQRSARILARRNSNLSNRRQLQRPLSRGRMFGRVMDGNRLSTVREDEVFIDAAGAANSNFYNSEEVTAQAVTPPQTRPVSTRASILSSTSGSDNDSSNNPPAIATGQDERSGYTRRPVRSIRRIRDKHASSTRLRGGINPAEQVENGSSTERGGPNFAVSHESELNSSEWSIMAETSTEDNLSKEQANESEDSDTETVRPMH